MHSVSPADSTSSRQAWLVVGFLWGAFCIGYIDRQVAFAIFPVLQTDLAFTNSQLGLVGSTFIWTYSLGNLVVGRLADVFSRKLLILVSVFLWNLTVLATVLSDSPGSFLFWRGALGVAQALYFPAAVSLIGTLHGAKRSTAVALHGTAQLAGIVLGATYGGWAADQWGWRTGFVALAAVGLLYLPVLATGLRNVPEHGPASNAIQASPGDVFHSRCFWALALAFFTFCSMLWMLYAWLPTFIYEKFSLSLAASGLTATLYLQSSSAVGILAGGVLADRLARRHRAARLYVFGAAVGLCAPFAILTLTVDSLTLLKLASSAFGLFAGAAAANIFPAGYDVVSRNNYGFSTGFLNMTGGLAGGIGTLAAGQWKESLGIEGVMAPAAAAGFVSALILLGIAARNFEADRRRSGAGEPTNT